ncbi:MAG: hypothetical protein ACLQPN_17525 [Bryobacteraceae bacterium]
MGQPELIDFSEDTENEETGRPELRSFLQIPAVAVQSSRKLGRLA